MQREANRLFGFTVQQTLDYTQSLYEKKLCTYPRTDSQFLTEDMQDTARRMVQSVLDKLDFAQGLELSPDIGRIINNAKVSDHHAIIPTAELEKTDLSALPETERKIWSLISFKLLCAVAKQHIYETVAATLECSGYSFTAKGKSVLSERVKSLALTAEWENALTLIARGELAADAFMQDISVMDSELVKQNSNPNPEYADLFGQKKMPLSLVLAPAAAVVLLRAIRISIARTRLVSFPCGKRTGFLRSRRKN